MQLESLPEPSAESPLAGLAAEASLLALTTEMVQNQPESGARLFLH